MNIRKTKLLLLNNNDNKQCKVTKKSLSQHKSKKVYNSLRMIVWIVSRLFII